MISKQQKYVNLHSSRQSEESCIGGLQKRQTLTSTHTCLLTLQQQTLSYIVSLVFFHLVLRGGWVENLHKNSGVSVVFSPATALVQV